MSKTYDARTTADVIVTDLAHIIKGKTILTTGVSPKGLGAYFVEYIAGARPELLILAGRNTEKVNQTAAALASSGVKTKTLALDLASLASCRQAAAEVMAWTDVGAVDVLVNNAGIMACDYGVTEDGFEMQFGTCHLGPFLFTNLVLDKIMASSEPRIVTVASDGHRLGPMRGEDTNYRNGENYDRWRAYGQAKTANMLMTLSLAEKLGPKGLTAVSLHPGVIGTNLGDGIDWDVEFPKLRM